MKTKFITTTAIAVLAIIVATTTTATSVQAVFEDDGEFVPDGEEQSQEEQEQQEEEYDDRNLPTYDEDTGKYNDEDDNGIDDDSKANDDEENLPRCRLGVVVDCILNDLDQTCEVGTSEDACQDIYGGVQGSPERDANGQLIIDKPNPYCDTPKGKAAKVCHDRLDYDDVTGLAPCNDGTQKADYKDCKDATKKNDDNDNDDNDNDNDNDSPQPVSCEDWSYTLDMKLAAQNATSAIIDRMPLGDAQNAEIDKWNALVAINNEEVLKWNAECAA